MPDAPRETVLHLEVPSGYRAGERLDVYLADKVAGLTRSKAQRSLRAGHVTVNGTVQTKPSTPVQAGDRIALRLLRPPPVEAVPEPIPLTIVYEDDDLIVVDKPAGMVVHPAYGHARGTLVNALLHHVGAGAVAFEPGEADPEDEDDPEDEEVGLAMATAAPRFKGDRTVRPGIVHRLDKDTSGLLVVARHDAALAALAAQFAARTIRRTYLGITWGVPDPPEGTVDAPVGRDPRDRKRMAVVAHGKPAVTHYTVLEAHAHTALVAFRLETGRTHQIRVHARHLGHPLLGDPTYDGDRLRAGPDTARRRQFFRNLLARMPRQALHAHTLGFRHPRTGEAMDFSAPLPDDMAFVLARLRAVEGAEAPWGCAPDHRA